MSDPRSDQNHRARELFFKALFRNRRDGLPRAVTAMRDLNAQGVAWEDIDCMFDPKRARSEEVPVYQAVADALKQFAQTGK